MQWTSPKRRTSAPLLILAVIAATGCGGAPDARVVLGDAAPRIDDVTFGGNHRFTDRQLVDAMHTTPHSWMPFTTDHRYDRALIAVDRARLEAWYAAHGFHAARVTGVEVRPDGSDAVDLHLIIAEGEPTTVRALDFVWAPEATLDLAARPIIERRSTVRRDRAFEVGQLNDTLGTLRLALEAWGYPLAGVTGRARVYADARRADVEIRLDPGPHATVGEIVIEGLVGVPEDLVQRELRFARGLEYSPQVKQSIRDVLRGMDLFRWVSVQASKGVEGGRVALRVRVSEADPQTIRLGVQAGFDQARWEQQLLARYTHTNLGGRLYRLDLDVRLGWAELPTALNPATDGPALAVEPTFTKKGLLEDELLWSLGPAYALDIREGYTYQEPRNRLGVSRWFGRSVRAELSHTVRFFDFLRFTDAFDAAGTELGQFDFRDPYLLSVAGAELELLFLDSVLQPEDGAAVSLSYALAGGPLQGSYDFHKWVASWRGYWTPWSWMQWAGRSSIGGIVPYGDRPDAPVTRRFYLGGATSVRGWGAHRLSPRADCGPDDQRCDGVPIGGFSMVQGNLELRLRVGAGFTLVGFADVGDVQAEASTWVVDELSYSAGPGLRYDSPVGVFRLDLGLRLNDTGRYAAPMWAAHFGLGESF